MQTSTGNRIVVKGDNTEVLSDSQSSARRTFVTGLLAQQDEHQRLGLKDPKGLFQYSKAASKQSRLRAIRAAKEDAILAREITHDQTLEIIDRVLDMVE